MDMKSWGAERFKISEAFWHTHDVHTKRSTTQVESPLKDSTRVVLFQSIHYQKCGEKVIDLVIAGCKQH